MTLDVTVVFCTEFGRTPGLEQRAGGKDGWDHHQHGFTLWFAGAGIEGGTIHGGTDELGCHALGEGRYATDVHATALKRLKLQCHPPACLIHARNHVLDHGDFGFYPP